MYANLLLGDNSVDDAPDLVHQHLFIEALGRAQSQPRLSKDTLYFGKSTFVVEFALGKKYTLPSDLCSLAAPMSSGNS